MKNTMFIFSILSIIATSTFAQTHIPAGNVSGLWTFSNSPYIIDGEITIRQNDKLIVEPGVQVLFSGHYKMIICGQLFAIGTETQTILFSSKRTQTGWHGIRFWGTSTKNDSSRLEYCILSYGRATAPGNSRGDTGGAIFAHNYSMLIISHCQIKDNHADLYGGGIFCDSSNITLSENIISANSAVIWGGGIVIESSSAVLSENIINNNRSQMGGGILISSRESTILLANNIIYCNNAKEGGGIYCGESNLILKNNTILFNYAESTGAGIYFHGNFLILLNTIVWENFTDYSDNQIYLSYGRSTLHYCCIQGGLQGIGPSYSDIVYSHCIESNPQFGGSFYLTPFSSCIDAGAPWSRLDENGSVSDIGALTTYCYSGAGDIPAGSIGGKISGTISSDMVVCEDVIVEEEHTLKISHGVTLYGFAGIRVFGTLEAVGSITDTIKFVGIEGGFWRGIDFYDSTSSNSRISYNLISNSITSGICCYKSSPTIENSKISKNYAINGGGIYCYQSSSHIESNIIENNKVENGGGIYCANSNPTIVNNIISNNYSWLGAGGISCIKSNLTIKKNLITNNFSPYGAGGIRFSDSNPMLINNTITTNKTTTYSGYSGAISANNNSKPTLLNCIIWNNEPEKSDIVNSSVTATYSCIQGGWTGTGNIDENPLFLDPENGDFNLTKNSPCIDAGDPNSPLDPDSTIADMGAFHYNQGNSIVNEDHLDTITVFKLLQNYPNPFNSETNIQYSIPTECNIELIIFNIRGQLVRKIVDEKQKKGSHLVIWNGKDINEKDVSSGIYFYKIKAGNYSKLHKMILTK